MAASGWGGSFVRLCLFLGVVAGALYGYKTYALRQARGFGGGGAGFGGGAGAFGAVGRSVQGFGYDSKRF